MERALKKYFGYDSFRKGQKEIISNILKGRDVLSIMPTGAGKSICYQLPAVMLSGITIVVSPLISLMADQVRALIELGIRGAYLNSTLTYKQYNKALYNASQGVYKIIYVAPERLESPEFIDVAKNMDISILAVDEAHCVSQWGQDFRPSYLKIEKFINALNKRPVICALTATATKEVEEDIISLLSLNDPFIVKTGFDRPNLYFEAKETPIKITETLRVIRRHKDESGIIYCNTRKNVDELCQLLIDKGFSATKYHAGLEQSERITNQNDFIFDRKNIMVATNAFGMGINKADVRYVVHYNMPKSLEFYYQEAGRAGRDGEKAECVLLYNYKDYATNKYLIENSPSNEDLTDEQIKNIYENDIKKLNQIKYYSTLNKCLRNYMLYYFGEDSEERCNNCSNCIRDNEIVENENRTVDYNLVNVLNKLRRELAKTNHISASTLFTDATIRDMAVKKPTKIEDMANISGMNRYKLKKYGDSFVEAIREYLEV